MSETESPAESPAESPPAATLQPLRVLNGLTYLRTQGPSRLYVRRPRLRRVDELAAELGVEVDAMAAYLEKLERRGLIDRVPQTNPAEYLPTARGVQLAQAAGVEVRSDLCKANPDEAFNVRRMLFAGLTFGLTPSMTTRWMTVAEFAEAAGRAGDDPLLEAVLLDLVNRGALSIVNDFLEPNGHDARYVGLTPLGLRFAAELACGSPWPSEAAV